MMAAVMASLCYFLAPFALHGMNAAVLGLAVGLAILFTELRLRRATPQELAGGAVGLLFGVFAATLVATVVVRTSEPASTKSFIELISLLGFGYIGMALGAYCGDRWQVARVPNPTSPETASNEPASAMKLLDTSVLIDGRIAEICESQFLDGVLAVPQFVLHELQLVADSADALKRQRGRRGLEVLQRIQKMAHVKVRVVHEDFAHTNDVDHKLIELARRTGAKIVTNDFNLNKVATVQGFSVLNVNQLANALKPAVLPGETMRVLILREGKEPSQGVAYLSDGTMVVVDGARRLINKSLDIIVTSVHQTTAGKMIFGRVDDRSDTPAGLSRAATAGRPTSFTSGHSYGATSEDEAANAGDVHRVERFPEPGVE